MGTYRLTERVPPHRVLQEVGYQHGKTVFDVWSRSGVVQNMMKDRHLEDFHNTQSKSNVRRVPLGSTRSLPLTLSSLTVFREPLLR